MGCAQSLDSPKSSPASGSTPSPSSMPVAPYPTSSSSLSFACPIHPASYAQPLSCAHCMAASFAAQPFASSSSSAHTFRASSSPVHHPPSHPYPLVTARQITSHWSSRYTQDYATHDHPTYLPSLSLPSSTTSTLSPSHSPSLRSSPSSRSPCPLSPHLPVRHKTFVHVEEAARGAGWGGEDLSVLKEQLSMFRERRKREVSGSSAGARSDSGGEEARVGEGERVECYADHEEDKGGEDEYEKSMDGSSGGGVGGGGGRSSRATVSRHLTLVAEEKGEEDDDLAQQLRHTHAGLEERHVDVCISV